MATNGAEQAKTAALVREGMTAAREISHPILRARHIESWIYRLARVEPASVPEWIELLPDDPTLRAGLLLSVQEELLQAGAASLDPHFAATLALAESMPADIRLRLLNGLSELGIELAASHPEEAVEHLRRLVPLMRSLTAETSAVPEERQPAALAAALLGEALLPLDADVGTELLTEAEALSEGLAGRGALLGFLAGVLAERQPEHALELLAAVDDPAARLEAALQILPKLTDPALREQAYARAEADAQWVEHLRGPEALVRLGTCLHSTDPDRARPLFQKALDSAAGSPPQIRSLQWAGVATALAGLDREWSRQVFLDAAAAVRQEEERSRRVTALAMIADEMAESFPREAAVIFEEAAAEAVLMDATWELAHFLEVVFRPDRSQFLDPSPARQVIEAALARQRDDDPRIPGVLGLPELGNYLRTIDPEAAGEVYQRWFQAARACGDTDGMTQAALVIYRQDPEAGKAALGEARDLLLRRIDCPSMGEFSRQVAGAAPELVLTVAERIPDRRERADALAAVAAGLYRKDPARSVALIREMERASDRSSGILVVVDRLLGTEGLPQPQPLLEDLP